MARGLRSFLAALPLCCSACSAEVGTGCREADVDGVIGGKYVFEVVVDDDGFDPTILKVQNTAAVTLILTNDGSTPHGFAVDCLSTPNDTGCPTKSCFPSAPALDAVAPGESTTVKFAAPRVEGIYTFRSPEDGGTGKGQFVVQ